MSQAGIIDVIGTHPEIPTLFVADVGTAIPIANTIEILGNAVVAHGVPLQTTASGNTIDINVQYASAAVSSVAANAGVASFNSAQFSVDANGFVTLSGSAAIESFQVDASTPPGTNPVVPNISGIVTITGSQVAAGTTTNVIRTDSLAINTYTIEIQRSQAVASSTIGDNGVSHFNSTYFTVDANGFVSINGGAVGETITGDVGGALSPTAGNWNIFASSTAAGTTPVQTSGSGSTLTIQVQKAQAIASTNATNVGLAAFDSSVFNVDSNAFVTSALGSGRFPITPYVVGPIGVAGYQTIQSALNAANAAGGGVVYVQPGTYTENLTLFGTTEVVGVSGNSDFATPGNTTIISGVHVPPTTGSFVFANVSLLSATHVFSSAVAGSAALFLINVETILTNGFIFNVPNWTGTLSLYNVGDFSTNNGAVNNTAGCTCIFFSATLGNGTGQTMVTSGPVTMQEIALRCPWNATTGTIIACDYDIFSQTVTLSNNSTGFFNYCEFNAGSTAALTMSSSASIKLIHGIVNSSNNPAITGAGAGTLTYANIIFISNAAFAGTLTLTTPSWQPYARAIASTDGTKVGTAAFNSAQFTVDANGFVSTNGSAIPNTITGQSGGALSPTAGNWNIFGGTTAAGTNPVVTSGSVSTLTVNVQTSQALAAADATKIGLSNFDSASFSVSATGFVTMAGGGGFTWNDVSGAFSPLKNNGYFITGTATGTLPASPAQGDTVKFFVDHASQVLTIKAPGTQIIRFGSLVSSAGGTFVSTLQGDSVELTYRASDTCWCAIAAFTGTWTLT